MSDKVRGALFNVLGDISGLSVLDAFSGSGALSFEAVSRGAANATAIDSDRSAQRAITESITELGLAGNIKLIKSSAGSWLSTTSSRYDLVFCDPPYDEVKPQLLLQLADRAEPGGIVVLSLPPAVNIALPSDFTLAEQKDYGDATLSFYKRGGRD
jgi:16S rRNA (guanine966-N2)-methyltransferase